MQVTYYLSEPTNLSKNGLLWNSWQNTNSQLLRILLAFTARDLKKLSELLPPSKTARGRRERNLRSFAEFMVMWMGFLSHLVAVAVCARILSATADHVTGGRTRRWLFGYETRSLGEPWPDVLGVTVVMVVCAMFMCGLEVRTDSSSFILFRNLSCHTIWHL